MKRLLHPAVLIHFLVFFVGLSQPSSVILKVKESSGFLGLGGARFIEIRLSSETRHQPLNSINVNEGRFYYFECLPAGNWELDADFVRDNLSRLTIEQNNLRETISHTGDLQIDGDTTSIRIGFSKSLKIQEPFLFRIQLGDVQNQVQYTVPREYWPGYESLEKLLRSAELNLAANRFGESISCYRAIIADNAYHIFPQQAEAKIRLIRTFQACLDANRIAFQSLMDSTQLDLQRRIARVEQFRSQFMFVIDSLTPLRFDLAPHDSSVMNILDEARTAVLRIGSVTDSLQNAYDEKTVQWILEGSVTGKNGNQYQSMIEALAYAYSSLDFADTNATRLAVSIPRTTHAHLEKNNLAESYKTFVRVCSDRFQMKLALFPVEFLPNLRRDTSAFPLPFYFMLKAVSDFYGGNLSACKEDIVGVFRTCYETELLKRFDDLRVIVDGKLNHVPQNVFRIMEEGNILTAEFKIGEAADKYRQAVIIVPNFAYASFALGKLSLQTGDTALAISLFQKTYQSDTLYLSAYLECYDRYRLRGDFRSMVDVMSISLARGNDYWITNYCLGQAFLANAEPLRALGPFRRALDLNPQSYETCMQLGRAYQSTRDFLKAREYFNRAIEIDALRKEAVDALSKLNEQQHSKR
jgi:tetratricopeptide (TPR) repeat protein